MLNEVILLVFYFAMSIIVPTFATSKRNKLIITKKKDYGSKKDYNKR